jgi:hypothetical protein
VTRFLAAFAVGSAVALGVAQAQQVAPSPAEREAKAREFFTDTLLRTESIARSGSTAMR